jgi:hypothetical protein
MSRFIVLSIAALLIQMGTGTAQSRVPHSHPGPAGRDPVPDHEAVEGLPRVSKRAPATDPRPGLYLGDAVAFGRGTARTLVTIDIDGRPTSLGVSLSASALDGLPAEAPADDIGWLHRLPLPSVVALPPFDHIALYWNPHGHDPHGVYDVAHIDVHFFMSSPEEVDRITAMDRDLERCYRLPPASAIPPGYILPPGTQHRRMGVHWVDANANEFKGQPFTASFLLGSYDHQINFLEPMIARAFLASRPDVTKDVPQPAAFARAGWYPSTWTVRWDGQRGEYLVALGGLKWQDATVPPVTAAPVR